MKDSSTTASSVRAILNFVNPAIAPADPKVTLGGNGLGDEEKVDEILVGKTKQIRNGRACRFDLKEDGFELLNSFGMSSISPLQQLSSSDSRQRYYAVKKRILPLAVQLAKEKLGLNPYYAHFVVPLFRKASSSSQVDTRDHNAGNAPHSMVHSDYGFNFLDQAHSSKNRSYLNIRNPAKAQEVAENFEKAGRIVVLQFWMNAQPPGTVIENDTLALCHPRSVQPTDLVTRRVQTYNGIKVDFQVVHGKDSQKRHEWFYWPSLTRDECLVWIGYDSGWGDNMRPCFHTSFHDPTVKSSRSRESVECRVVLLLDPKEPAMMRSRL